MAYGRKILSKYGWKEGDGLGLEGQGIKNPIKSRIKDNNQGIGYNVGKEMTKNWWDDLYNKALSNIVIEEEHDGKSCKIKQIDENAVEITTFGKKNLSNALKEYGLFQKELNVNGEDVEPAKVVTDEYLFKKCKGRTGHKGARHGLYLTGKLERIRKQEEEFLQSKKRNQRNSEILPRKKKKKNISS